MADTKQTKQVINSLGVELQNLQQDSKEYQNTLDQIVESVRELQFLDKEREDSLREYIKGLESTEDLLGSIENHLQRASALEEHFRDNVGAVRNILSDILNETSSIGSRLAYQLRPFRELRNLAGEFQRAFSLEGGVTEKSLALQQRKVRVAAEEYTYRVKRLTGISAEVNLLEAVRNNEREVLGAIEKARDRELERVELLERRLSLEKNLTREVRRNLNGMLSESRNNLELLSGVTMKVVDGFQLAVDRRKKIFDESQKQIAAMGFASNFLDRVGVPGVKKAYSDYLQESVQAREDLEVKRGVGIEARQEYRKKRSEYKKTVQEEKPLIEQAEAGKKAIIDSKAFNGVDIRDRVSQLEQEIGEYTKAIRKARTEKNLASAEWDSDIENNEKFNTAAEKERILIGLEAKQEALYSKLEGIQNKYGGLISDLNQFDEQIRKSNDRVETSKIALENAEQERVEASERYVEAQKKVNQFSKGELGALQAIGKNLLQNLGSKFTALHLALEIWNAFKNVSAEAAELKRRVGSWEIGTAAVNSKLATSVDWLKTAADLADFTGLNSVMLFDNKQIASAAEFKNLTGASAEEANNLLVRSKLVGQSTDAYRDSLAAGANEGNRLNRSVVTLGEVQEGVLKTSDATALSYGNNARELGKAVVAAKNLGLELAGVEKIADGLLKFESSIASEMEAQLLTGQMLNLSKAREYALSNDLEGVAREIQNQGITAARFSSMNRIQQESIAKALGMSRDELAKSLILRQLNNGASAEALAAATGMTKEQVEAIGLQERWRIATEKLVQALTPVLEIVLLIVKPITWVVTAISGLVGWVGTFIGSIAGIFSGEADKFNAGLGKTEKTFKAIAGGLISVIGLAVGFTTIVSKWPAILGKVEKLKDTVSAPFSLLGEAFKGSKEGGGFFKTLLTKAKERASGSERAAENSLGIPERASKVSEVTATGEGLEALGDNIQKFVRKFVGIGRKDINVALLAARKVIGIKGVTIDGTGEGLEALGDSIQKFIRKFIGISRKDVNVALLAARKAVGIKGVTIDGTGEGLETLGENIQKFISALGEIKVKDVLMSLLVAGTLTLMSPFLKVISIVSSTGSAVDKGLPLFGRGIRNFFRTINLVPYAAIVKLGAIAVVFGGAFAAIGWGLGQAAPVIEAFGTVIKSAFEGIATLVKAVGETIPVVFDSIVSSIQKLTFEDIGKIAALGVTLAVFGVAVMSSLPGLLQFGLLGLPVLLTLGVVLVGLAKGVQILGDLKTGMSELVLLSNSIKDLTDNLSKFSTTLEELPENKVLKLTTNLQKLEEEKSERPEVQQKVETSRIETPKISIQGAVDTASRKQQIAVQEVEDREKVVQTNLKKVEDLLESIDKKLGKGQNIYLDAIKVGHAISLA